MPLDLTPVPLGADTLVKSGLARYPAVTALPDGGFVVTSVSYDFATGTADIYGRRYDSTGTAVGSEFRINTYTLSDQLSPTVTALADGGFVVTWSSGGQVDGTSWEIYGQRYSSTGVRVGSEFHINTYSTDNQVDSSVTALSDGGFVVTWSSVQDSTPFGPRSYGVYGQRYDSLGTPVAGEFRVNTFTADSQGGSSTAALSDGGFVVTWTSMQEVDGFSTTLGIYGQRYDSAGSPVGSEFHVNTATVGAQAYSSVAGLADGGFVVTWSSQGQDGSGWGVYGQRYDGTGAPAGSEFRANTFTVDDQLWSSITALDDGGFVVTWSSFGQEGSGWGLYGQRFSKTGALLGGEFRLNSITDSDQANETAASDPALAILADGRLVQVFATANGVYYRLVDVPASPPGDPPSGTDATLAAFEDQLLTLAAADFGFTDPEPANNLAFVRIASLPAAGTLFLDGDNDGIVDAGEAVTTGQVVSAAMIDNALLKFLAAADASGIGYASFTFSVSNGIDFDPSPNTITLDVAPVNDAPVAVADSGYATLSNEPLSIAAASLADNDADVDGDALTVVSVQDARHGNVTLATGGNVVFTPTAGYAGPASFTYTVSDGHGGLATATVSVTVMPVVINGPATGNGAVDGTAAADFITAGSGNNSIAAGAGDDVVTAGAGKDTVSGGDGDDRFVATQGDGSDRYDGGSGTDTYDLSQISVSVTVDLARGKASSSQSGNDTLIDMENAIGGSGSDTFNAGAAANAFTGGDGADRFVFASTASAGIGATRDTITDFTPGLDTIDISGIDANTAKGGKQAFAPVVLWDGTGEGFSGPAQLKYHYETIAGVEFTVISGNVDADLAADFQIALVGHHTLSSSDFQL